MLFNLLDIAIPTLPMIVADLLDDTAIFILGAIGVIALIAVITIFYLVSKKKKTANPSGAKTDDKKERNGEE